MSHQQFNRQILFVNRPINMPDENCFNVIISFVPKPATGQMLIRTKFISVDPYMRGRMNDQESYISPFPLNEVVHGGVVGEVIESKCTKFKIGDLVIGNLGWQDYSIADEDEVKKLESQFNPSSIALGVLGMPGLTAYFGLLDIGQPKKDETVVVSGAAGAVGTVVGQIAKIYGCRVVGIAGSFKKISYLTDELGFDTAINYRTAPDLRIALEEACPKGIDIYFDNVGGIISDSVMSLINNNARIPVCGQISLYNDAHYPTGPRIQPQLLTHSALMKGFLVHNYSDRFEDGILKLSEWFGSKQIKYTETIVDGLENTPKAFLGLFSGDNIGKQLVRVS